MTVLPDCPCLLQVVARLVQQSSTTERAQQHIIITSSEPDTVNDSQVKHGYSPEDRPTKGLSWAQRKWMHCY